MNKNKHHVVIVGGGFGGIKAALKLAHNEHVHVTLVSDRPNFRYYPALFHTATGGLNAQSSIQLDSILPTKLVDIIISKVEKLDRDKNTVITVDGHKIAYDTIIFSLGSQTNYFGIPGLPEFSYGIKSYEEIQRFKAHLHQQLTDDHKPDLNYVIVGAGPTGIELAGALPGYLRKIMQNHGIKHRAINIDIVEAAPRLLPRSPKSISNAVRRQLHKLGIKIYLGQTVQGETADSLMVSDKPISSHTVIWTAGVANSPFFKENDFTMSDRGKVVVNDYLEASDGVYVIGDNAATQYSGMAQTALYDGVFVAADIAAKLDHRKRKTYKPKKPITIIPAGPMWATVEWGRFKFTGKSGFVLRELADLKAFLDYEPWWKAAEQWTTELGTEEHCPTCAAAQNN